MLFRSVTVLFSSVFFTQGVFAALTPNDVVVNVNIVASVSGNLNSILGGLTVSTSAQTVATIAQTTVTDFQRGYVICDSVILIACKHSHTPYFQTIITNLAGDVTAMEATPPFADGVTQPVVDSLTAFVEIHQALLSTVIGKHGIFAQFGATAPIAAILRSLEAGIDSFAFAMIALLPTRTSDVTVDKNSLDTSVGNTITLYQQICIPSLLFPALMPVCVSL